MGHSCTGGNSDVLSTPRPESSTACPYSAWCRTYRARARAEQAAKPVDPSTRPTASELARGSVWKCRECPTRSVGVARNGLCLECNDRHQRFRKARNLRELRKRRKEKSDVRLA